MQALESDNWFEIAREDYNFTYILYGFFILKTSFIQSVFMIRLCNVLLLINSMVICYKVLKKFFNTNPKHLYYCMWFIGLNGIITWTAIRNLKDVMFLFLLVSLIYYLLDFFMNRKWSIFRIVLMVGICYVLQDIRQWFLYLFAGMIVIGIGGVLLKKRKYFLAISLAAVSVILLLSFYSRGLSTMLLYRVAYSETQSTVLGGDAITGLINGGLLSLPMSMARFILGPGPIRGLFGSEAFLTYTQTGNVLIFLGGMAWWIFLPLFIMSLFSIKHFKQRYMILAVLLFYWATYSFAYAGSGDTRLRVILYVLCAMYTIPYISDYWKKKYIVSYVALLVPLCLIGSLFSYVGLQ